MSQHKAFLLEPLCIPSLLLIFNFLDSPVFREVDEEHAREFFRVGFDSPNAVADFSSNVHLARCWTCIFNMQHRDSAVKQLEGLFIEFKKVSNHYLVILL